MKQLSFLLGLGLLCLGVSSCTSDTSAHSPLQVESPIPPDLGIFQQQYAKGAAFQYDTTLHQYTLPKSKRKTLRFISTALQEDFMLKMKLPEQTLADTRFGILLALDVEGEKPIAALQVVDGKLMFAPDTGIGNTNTLAVSAAFIQVEYINGQISAYYGTDEHSLRPIAVQQMEDTTSMYVGLFARTTAQDIAFEQVELTYPKIEPPLSQE